MARQRYGPVPEILLNPPTCRPLAPVPADVTVFECGRCGAPLPLLAMTDVWHDCATGEVSPV